MNELIGVRLFQKVAWAVYERSDPFTGLTETTFEAFLRECAAKDGRAHEDLRQLCFRHLNGRLLGDPGLSLAERARFDQCIRTWRLQQPPLDMREGEPITKKMAQDVYANLVTSKIMPFDLVYEGSQTRFHLFYRGKLNREDVLLEIIGKFGRRPAIACNYILGGRDGRPYFSGSIGNLFLDLGLVWPKDSSELSGELFRYVSYLALIKDCLQIADLSLEL